MADHDHEHDHERTVAPMVDEITDFEVLEIALRELCIEKGIFTAEEHRRFTEFAEQIGPTPAARLVARAWLDPDFKKLALADAMPPAKRSVSTGWSPPVSGRRATSPRCKCSKTPPLAPRDCLRSVLVLPAADSGQFPGVVPHAQLSPPPGALAAPGARGVRALSIRRHRDPGGGFRTRNTVSW